MLESRKLTDPAKKRAIQLQLSKFDKLIQEELQLARRQRESNATRAGAAAQDKDKEVSAEQKLQVKQTLRKKLVARPKPGTDEFKEYALKEIYNYYSKLRIASNVNFEDRSKVESISKGEFNQFCKDYEIGVPPSKIQQVFTKISPTQVPLSEEDFRKTLPLLALGMVHFKKIEIKARLREIKQVLEYPDNNVELSEEILDIMFQVDKKKYVSMKARQHKESKPRGEERKNIDVFIPESQYDTEKAEATKILAEIEKIMNSKRYLAQQESNLQRRTLTNKKAKTQAPGKEGRPDDANEGDREDNADDLARADTNQNASKDNDDIKRQPSGQNAKQTTAQAAASRQTSLKAERKPPKPSKEDDGKQPKLKLKNTIKDIGLDTTVAIKPQLKKDDYYVEIPERAPSKGLVLHPLYEEYKRIVHGELQQL